MPNAYYITIDLPTKMQNLLRTHPYIDAGYQRVAAVYHKARRVCDTQLQMLSHMRVSAIQFWV